MCLDEGDLLNVCPRFGSESDVVNQLLSHHQRELPLFVASLLLDGFDKASVMITFAHIKGLILSNIKEQVICNLRQRKHSARLLLKKSRHCISKENCHL